MDALHACKEMPYKYVAMAMTLACDLDPGRYMQQGHPLKLNWLPWAIGTRTDVSTP